MKRAFTLVELLVCIAIIAILVCLLIPALSAVRDVARKNSILQGEWNNGKTVISFGDGGKATVVKCTEEYLVGFSFTFSGDIKSGKLKTKDGSKNRVTTYSIVDEKQIIINGIAPLTGTYRKGSTTIQKEKPPQNPNALADLQGKLDEMLERRETLERLSTTLSDDKSKIVKELAALGVVGQVDINTTKEKVLSDELLEVAAQHKEVTEKLDLYEDRIVRSQSLIRRIQRRAVLSEDGGPQDEIQVLLLELEEDLNVQPVAMTDLDIREIMEEEK